MAVSAAQDRPVDALVILMSGEHHEGTAGHLAAQLAHVVDRLRVGIVHVEQDDVHHALANDVDGGRDRVGLGDHGDVVVFEQGAHAGAAHRMLVDENEHDRSRLAATAAPTCVGAARLALFN